MLTSIWLKLISSNLLETYSVQTTITKTPSWPATNLSLGKIHRAAKIKRMPVSDVVARYKAIAERNWNESHGIRNQPVNINHSHPLDDQRSALLSSQRQKRAYMKFDINTGLDCFERRWNVLWLFMLLLKIFCFFGRVAGGLAADSLLIQTLTGITKQHIPTEFQVTKSTVQI